MKSKILALFLLSFTLAYAFMMTEHEFTQVAANMIKKAFPGCQVEIAGDLEIGFASRSGKKLNLHLENAYSEYLLKPDSYEDIIGRHIQALIYSQDSLYLKLSTARNIVPVIKNGSYVNSMDSVFKSTDGESFVREKLNDELFICYAYNDLFTIRFLMTDKFDSLNIPIDSLRTLTILNLKSALDNISVYDTGGVYYLVADGNYEASLLLFDDIWKNEVITVNGELVAAVPARDLLAVTGSKDDKGLAKLLEFAASADSCPYPISDKLFIRRNGNWEIFIPDDTNSGMGDNGIK